jgi:pimeloyl-ACP methyl ester carboxylesterase
MIWKLVALIFITGLVTSCTPNAGTPSAVAAEAGIPAATPTLRPAYSESACPFEAPEGYVLVCGYLTVPENRSRPEEGDIRLAVAIFKSTAASPAPDPVIQLAGGPGASPLGALNIVLKNGGGEILKQRDFIIFDQRGAGYSEPDLFCQPYDEYLWNARELNTSQAEYNAGALPSLGKCLEEWRAEGVDLEAYNSAENAADVNDLRLALGYDQVNLYGISYGSRLALTVMRDHPEGLRSVILDAVYPPQVNLDLDMAANAERALGLLFSACAESEACTAEYGDLEAKFYTVIDRLNASPAQIDVFGPYRSSFYKVYIGGDLFIDLIYGSLYKYTSLPYLPLIIQLAYEGHYSELEELIATGIGSGLSTGMLWSVFCREEIPFEIADSAPGGKVPKQLSQHFSLQTSLDICRLWNIPPAASIENEAVVSNIPVLIYAGLHDPITPPSYAEAAAATLSRHYYYLFPNAAHGVMRSDTCALQIGLDFLENPAHEPDHACMGDLSGLKLP